MGEVCKEQKTQVLAPAAVVRGVEPVGEDFFLGTVATGFLVGHSDRSYGFGLFFGLMLGEEPGIQVVLGPLGFYAKKYIGWDLRFLRWHLLGG